MKLKIEMVVTVQVGVKNAARLLRIGFPARMLEVTHDGESMVKSKDVLTLVSKDVNVDIEDRFIEYPESDPADEYGGGWEDTDKIKHIDFNGPDVVKVHES